MDCVDLGTLIGIVLGFGLIVMSIMLNGSLMAFWNVPGLLIVVGGTLAATLINQKLQYVLGAMGVAMNAFIDRVTPIEEIVETIEEMTQKARKEGEELLRQGREEMEREKRAAVREIRGVAADLALAAAEKLVQERMDDPVQRRLVERYLEEMDSMGPR